MNGLCKGEMVCVENVGFLTVTDILDNGSWVGTDHKNARWLFANDVLPKNGIVMWTNPEVIVDGNE